MTSNNALERRQNGGGGTTNSFISQWNYYKAMFIRSHKPQFTWKITQLQQNKTSRRKKNLEQEEGKREREREKKKESGRKWPLSCKSNQGTSTNSLSNFSHGKKLKPDASVVLIAPSYFSIVFSLSLFHH